MTGVQTCALRSAHAVARGAEQIHGIEPANQRGPRIVQDGVGGWRNLKQAMRAGIDPALGQLVKLALYAASGAVHKRPAKAHRHDVFKAGGFVMEAGKELPNGEIRAGRGAFLVHADCIAARLTWVKGINGLICVFVLINWLGEACRCQRVSYFLAAEVEPKINDLLEYEAMNWEISLNGGKLRRDEIFGPSMVALLIVGLLGGITPVLAVNLIQQSKVLDSGVILKWLTFPYCILSISAAYAAGSINKIKNISQIEKIHTSYYLNITKFSFKIAITTLIVSLVGSVIFCAIILSF